MRFRLPDTARRLRACNKRNPLRLAGFVSSRVSTAVRPRRGRRPKVIDGMGVAGTGMGHQATEFGNVRRPRLMPPPT